MICLEVAVAVPLENTLTYSAPGYQAEDKLGLDPPVFIGRRVFVPLGKRMATGYVIGIQSLPTPTGYVVKTVGQFLDDSPIFHENIIPFFRWVANYYHYPIGLVIKAALPGGLTSRMRKKIRLLKDPSEILSFFRDDPPPWVGMLVANGIIPPNATTKLVADRKNRKILRILLDNQLIAFDSIKAKDLVREKKETFYSFTSKHFLPQSDVDSTVDAQKLYQQKIKADFGISLKHSEVKTLYHLRRIGADQQTDLVALRKLRENYSGAAKVLANLESKEIVVRSEKRIFRPIFGRKMAYSPRPEMLSQEQDAVLKIILPAIESKVFSPFLLHGVTGCGKTEIYLRAAEVTLRMNRDVLILVPEIALATQLEAHFLSRFGDDVVLLHSGLTGGERFDQYSLALIGKARVVIGARSAIFAPLQDPGLIVVDEEHDSSYKQDDSFRYHGRDLAVLRARHHQSVVILGSATPSVTSYANAQSGKYTLLTMTERVGDSSLPSVTLVDLNKKKVGENKGIIQSELLHKLINTLENKKQSILLINRRGFSAVVLCRDCGSPVQCTHCHVSLTLHKGKNRLVCHYCGFTMPGKTICLQCHSTDLVPAGFGTERVEEEVSALLPSARVRRLDSDTASDRKKFLATLAEMHDGKIDILIGTQMIAKGHHFPNVTLVGVVWADGGMNMPDFRAAERTFQLITQVTGRAGRGESPGEVIIQTMRPQHYAIVYAREQNFLKLYEHEMRLRKKPIFPPHVRLTSFRLKGRVESEVQQAALRLAKFCRMLVESEKLQIETLGPAPAPLDKIKDNYRWQILLKGKNTDELQMVSKMVHKEQNVLVGSSCILAIDVDPENMM